MLQSYRTHAKSIRTIHNPCLVLSIDGVKETIEHIRTLCNWETILKNIEIPRQRLNPNFMVNTVLQKDNLDNIPELAEWIEEQNISKWHTTILDKPKQYRFENYEGKLNWPESIWQFDCVKKISQVVESLKYISNYFKESNE